MMETAIKIVNKMQITGFKPARVAPTDLNRALTPEITIID